jgi:hypothetical protein
MLVEVMILKDGTIDEKKDAALIFVSEKGDELNCVEDDDMIERLAAAFGLDEDDDECECDECEEDDED